MIRLNSKQLRDLEINDALKYKNQVKRNGLILILENIYDTYNVGGLFRLADALAVEKMYLCGQMELPPNPKIAKASVGTDKIVPWEYRESAVNVIDELRAEYISFAKNTKPKTQADSDEKTGIRVFAVEQSLNSKPYNDVSYSSPAALIVGNETFGVTEETLSKVDQVVEIPMWGVNKSLNVIVSAAIVAYHAINDKR